MLASGFGEDALVSVGSNADRDASFFGGGRDSFRVARFGHGWKVEVERDGSRVGVDAAPIEIGRKTAGAGSISGGNKVVFDDENYPFLSGASVLSLLFRTLFPLWSEPVERH